MGVFVRTFHSREVIGKVGAADEKNVQPLSVWCLKMRKETRSHLPPDTGG